MQADLDSLKSTVVEEIVPAQCGINGLGTEEMHMADTLDNRLDQIFEGFSTTLHLLYIIYQGFHPNTRVTNTSVNHRAHICTMTYCLMSLT